MKSPKGFINCAVFGMIRLPKLCVSIIDTLECERLRDIKQLGFTSLVYPGGTHTRFYHSLGVFHLAKQMVEKLKENQSHLDEEARITEVDVLCVAVAGLCHDLGHGPFSHTWEKFMKRMRPESPWKHETSSVLIFRRIWDKLSPSDKRPLEEIDKIFIEEVITGLENPYGPWVCKGRPQAKSFLYEIVANKVNGVDVDRFAYISQDSYYLGIKHTFELSRLLELVQVVPVNGRNTICFKNSEARNLYRFFQTRGDLYRQAYRHRVACLIDAMFVDALELANDHLLTTGKNGMKLQLCETVDDLDAFLKMDDSVYKRIQRELPDDHPAHVLIDRIQTRDLYVQVGELLMPKGVRVPEAKIKEEMLKSTGDLLDPQDFYVNVEHFDYGKGADNPVHFINFYKEVDSVPVHVTDRSEYSHLLPDTFEEDVVIVACKRKDPELCSMVKIAFENWANTNVTGAKLTVENDCC